MFGIRYAVCNCIRRENERRVYERVRTKAFNSVQMENMFPYSVTIGHAHIHMQVPPPQLLPYMSNTRQQHTQC